MADMRWKKANGETGEYTGPLVELGQGIPREVPGHGFKRAMYDFAFGYVSGFPIRDILAFCFRRLFPSKSDRIFVTPVDDRIRNPLLQPVRVTAKSDSGEEIEAELPEEVQQALHAYETRHADIADLAATLEPFGLHPYDIKPPRFSRVVYEDELTRFNINTTESR